MRKLLNMVHSFMTDVERVELELSWIRKLWYVIVLIVTSIYVFIIVKKKWFANYTNEI